MFPKLLGNRQQQQKPVINPANWPIHSHFPHLVILILRLRIGEVKLFRRVELAARG